MGTENKQELRDIQNQITALEDALKSWGTDNLQNDELDLIELAALKWLAQLKTRAKPLPDNDLIQRISAAIQGCLNCLSSEEKIIKADVMADLLSDCKKALIFHSPAIGDDVVVKMAEAIAYENGEDMQDYNDWIDKYLKIAKAAIAAMQRDEPVGEK